MTHFEQDVLVIKRLADLSGIKKHASAEELNYLQSRYGRTLNLEDQTGNLNKAFFQQVLDSRNGKALTPSVSSRADKLIDSMKEVVPKSAIFGKQSTEMYAAEEIKEVFKKSSNPQEFQKYLHTRLAKNRYVDPAVLNAAEELKVHTLERIPVQLEATVQRIRDASELSFEKAKAIVTQNKQTYLDWYHEQEARDTSAAIDKLITQ